MSQIFLRISLRVLWKSCAVSDRCCGILDWLSNQSSIICLFLQSAGNIATLNGTVLGGLDTEQPANKTAAATTKLWRHFTVSTSMFVAPLILHTWFFLTAAKRQLTVEQCAMTSVRCGRNCESWMFHSTAIVQRFWFFGQQKPCLSRVVEKQHFTWQGQTSW